MKRIAVIAAVCAFVIAAAVAAGFLRMFEGRRVDAARRSAGEAGTSHAFAIARQVDTAVAAAQRLATVAENAPLTSFNTGARRILGETPVVFAAAFARDMRIAAVEPADAPDIILTDLARDPTRAADIRKLRESGRSIVAVPAVDILQAYAPVRSDGRINGVAIAYVRVADVLRAADVAGLLRSGYEYRITDGAGRAVTASTLASVPQPVRVSVPVAPAPWILEVAPARGWADRGAVARDAAAAIILSLMIAFFVYELLRRPEIIEIEAAPASAEVVRTEASAAREATHDPVTDLPNRRFVLERLARAIDRSRHVPYVFGVLVIDLAADGAANDHTLIDAAQRLQGYLRFGDVLARSGPSEFTAVVFEVADVTDLVRIAERCRGALPASSSMGIAMSSGDTSTPDGLLRDAHVAMTRARAQEGAVRYAFFDPEVHRRAVDTMQLENDLPRALSENGLRAVFQTVVSLPSKKVSGVEALMRWNRGGRVLLPAQFLVVAERSGGVVSLDRWMLRAAAQHPGQVIRSVNLSVKTLLDETFLYDIADASSMQIEIRERAFVEQPDELASVLRKIKEAGATVVLDDFGSGASSLSSLRSFPIDGVKIRNVADDKLLRALASTAQTLGWRVTVKNIETAAQMKRAEDLGADYGQGYYISKPE